MVTEKFELEKKKIYKHKIILKHLKHKNLTVSCTLYFHYTPRAMTENAVKTTNYETSKCKQSGRRRSTVVRRNNQGDCVYARI